MQFYPSLCFNFLTGSHTYRLSLSRSQTWMRCCHSTYPYVLITFLAGLYVLIISILATDFSTLSPELNEFFMPTVELFVVEIDWFPIIRHSRFFSLSCMPFADTSWKAMISLQHLLFTSALTKFLRSTRGDLIFPSNSCFPRGLFNRS